MEKEMKAVSAILILLSVLFVSFGTALAQSKAIIVAGGPQTDGLWPAIQKNAGLAYEALTFQGYTNDDIYFMSPVMFSTGVDGLPTLSNIEYAITTWAKSNTQDMVLYLIGNGGDGTFKVNETENLPGADLDTWLDALQETIPGNVVVVIDACHSGSFIPLLLPPNGKERIVATSTKSDENSLFCQGGTLSFSYIFWSHMLNGGSFYNSFLHGGDDIAVAYPDRQNAQVDANGNGIANEKEDKKLASIIKVGNENLTGVDLPTIGTVSPPQSLQGTSTALIYASDVIAIDGVARVWAVITPPGFTSASDDPITDLPVFDLSLSAGRYEGIYGGFNEEGTYYVAVFVQDQVGFLSLPVQTKVDVDSAPTTTPTVTTTAPTQITSTSALSGGNVTSDGGSTVTARGVCWSTSYNPNTMDSHTSDGTGTGSFSSQFLGLSPNTTYHVRAYATNSMGTSYGSDHTFKTSELAKTTVDKAIIVVGGGTDDNLWDSFEMCANYAYNALLYREYTDETIFYLSANTELNLDEDADPEVDDDASNKNLKTAIETWGQDADNLLIYLVGHGGEGTFEMEEFEYLYAKDLNDWLNTFQENNPKFVAMVHDSCHSGSFIPTLVPLAGEKRVLAASAAEDEPALFQNGGGNSFGYQFFSHVFGGEDFRESFIFAKNMVSLNQNSLIEADGNLNGEKKFDLAVAKDFKIGIEKPAAGGIPGIESISHTLSDDQTSVEIRAQKVMDLNGVDKVFAIIKPPNYSSGSSEVIDLPMVDFKRTEGNENDGTYEGTYNDLTMTGSYKIAVFAKNINGFLSLPKEITINVSSPLTVCDGCGGDLVNLTDVTFNSNTNCECTATDSITLGDGVTVRQGATMIFRIKK